MQVMRKDVKTTNINNLINVIIARPLQQVFI